MRLFWPVFSVSFNFISTLSIIVFNKLALRVFPYPATLTLFHYIVTLTCIRAARAGGLFPAASVPSRHTGAYYWLVISWAIANAISNASLSANSVGFYQLMKVLAAPTVAAVDWTVFAKRPSFLSILLLVGTCAGVVLATVNDLQLNLRGSILALAAVLLGVVQKVLSEHLQQRAQLTSLQLMDVCFLPMTFIGLVVSPLLDDFSTLIVWELRMRSVAPVFASAFVGVCVNLSTTMVLGTTSALALVLLGQLKTCSVLLAGVVLFHESPNVNATAGAAAAVACIGLYTWNKMSGSAKAADESSDAMTRPILEDARV